MAIKPEEMEEALAECQELWRRGEWHEYTARFAENAVFLNSALPKPLEGREQIRTYVAGTPKCDNQTEWLITEGNRLAFGWHERQEGMPDGARYRGISTYVFDDDGRITGYEGMFDLAAVAAAMSK